MHAVLTEEQEMLRSSAEQVGALVEITNPHELQTVDRAKGWHALADAGFLGLRSRDAGEPAASGVEVMLVAEALGAALAPLPYASAILAADLLARAGAAAWAEEVAEGQVRTTLLLDADLRGLARVDRLERAVAWDAEGAAFGLALTADGRGVARVALDGALAPDAASDLTRVVRRAGADLAGRAAEAAPGALDADDLARWEALALVVVCADAAGVMRRGLDRAVAYSKERIQYGVLIGTFQAIQHLCAEMLVRVEAAASTTRYAAWAVDVLAPDEALVVARTAKAYGAAAGRDVCETVMQVFGGIGQTWEHVAHLHTRRALLDGVVFGDEAHQLDHLAAATLGGS